MHDQGSSGFNYIGHLRCRSVLPATMLVCNETPSHFSDELFSRYPRSQRFPFCFNEGHHEMV